MYKPPPDLVATLRNPAVSMSPGSSAVERCVGDALTPSIRLAKLLGSGGMGTVWEADWNTRHDDPPSKRRVAVKLLLQSMVGNEMARERFRREGAAVMRIHSPHVAHVLARGVTARDEPFIVMEAYDGETLAERLGREEMLSLETTLAIVWQAGGAMAEAHRLGIVHRDIKPENIFLVHGECDPYVKLLDFGIAQDASRTSPRVTAAGLIVGTPAFMAPEQMLGGPVRPAADVFSLGVVTYLCITGQFPFQGDSMAALAKAIAKEGPILPSTTRSDLPPWFDHWLMGALTHDPMRRYADGATMLVELDKARHGRGRGGTDLATRPEPAIGGRARGGSVSTLPSASRRRFPRGGRRLALAMSMVGSFAMGFYCASPESNRSSFAQALRGIAGRAGSAGGADRRHGGAHPNPRAAWPSLLVCRDGLSHASPSPSRAPAWLSAEEGGAWSRTGPKSEKSECPRDGSRPGM